MQTRVENYFKKWQVSVAGILRVLRIPRYAALNIGIFLAFAWILTIFSIGNTDWNLLFSQVDWLGKLEIVIGGFVRIFTNLTSIDGVLTFLLSILQAVAISLIIFNFRRTRKFNDTAADSGIAGIIAIFGAGCPTCGTSLLLPILVTIFGAGVSSVWGSISWIITIVAFGLLLHALRKLGFMSNLKGEKSNGKIKKS